jgi:hypothetical protein
MSRVNCVCVCVCVCVTYQITQPVSPRRGTVRIVTPTPVPIPVPVTPLPHASACRLVVPRVV